MKEDVSADLEYKNCKYCGEVCDIGEEFCKDTNCETYWYVGRPS
jgi:hypothetical protein